MNTPYVVTFELELFKKGIQKSEQVQIYLVPVCLK